MLKRISLKKLHLELSTARVEALTDGVFAIALTLIVLGFGVKPDMDLGSDKLIAWLRSLMPLFHDYVVSFFILAYFWINHHRQFHFIKRTDSMLLRLNILSLLFICLIPFATSLQNSYGDLLPADLVFEFNMFCAGVTYYAHWSYATKNRRLVDKDLGGEVISIYKYRTAFMPVLSSMAMILSAISPKWGTSIYLIIPVLLFFMKRS